MTKHKFESQDKVAATLLFALYLRALEASQPDPLLRDERAIRLIEEIDYDFSRFKLSRMDQVFTLMRVREFDRLAVEFLKRAPNPVVVHIGCGLDTRFDRVDDGRVEWFDLDLPEVIRLRQALIPATDRNKMLGFSVFDAAWLEQVPFQPEKQYLFLAEGVFPYFTKAQVMGLFQLLGSRFPGCELGCDGMSALMVKLHNPQLAASKVQARLQWGLNNGHEPETWGAGIQLISEWFYFDRPEPHLGISRFMRYLPFFAKAVGIYHYQLGKRAI